MLKIGLAQLLVEPGNARGNVTRMKEYIREAITKNCDLIIFPNCVYRDISSAITGIRPTI